MTAAAYLAQSALEERLPDLTGPLSDVLIDSGFSSGAVEGVRSALLANRLAFTPQAVTDEMARLYTGLSEEHQLRTSDDPLQLVETAIERFLDSELAGPNAKAVYDNMADRAARYRQPHWWASCSLDLPSVLGPAKSPIYCARPGHRVSNRLTALEWTYRGTMSTGFNGKADSRGHVGVVTAGGGYRDTINDLQPNRYWDNAECPLQRAGLRVEPRRRANLALGQEGGLGSRRTAHANSGGRPKRGTGRSGENRCRPDRRARAAVSPPPGRGTDGHRSPRCRRGHLPFPGQDPERHEPDHLGDLAHRRDGPASGADIGVHAEQVAGWIKAQVSTGQVFTFRVGLRRCGAAGVLPTG